MFHKDIFRNVLVIKGTYLTTLSINLKTLHEQNTKHYTNSIPRG